MEAEIQSVQPESDEDLRRLYGEKATFSRAGRFTLVHLDSPSAEVVAQRTTEFDPDEFFVDDCALCQQAKAAGGHVVFDTNDDDLTESFTPAPAQVDEA